MARKTTPRKAKATDPDAWLEGGDADDATAPGVLVVTKQRLGQILKISPNTLEKYFAAGAPVVAKGNKKAGWQVDVGDFHQWVVRYKMDSVTPGDANAGDFEAAKSAKMWADAERSQMELARKKGETLTIDEAVGLYREEASIIRSQFMAIPGRVCIPASAETNPAIIEQMLEDELNIALSNISGDSREAWTNEDGPDQSA